MEIAVWRELIDYLATHPSAAKIVVGVVGALLGLEVIFAIGTIREVAEFRRRGYRVRLFRGKKYVYEELVVQANVGDRPIWRRAMSWLTTERRRLPFGEPVAGAVVAEVPNEDRWDEEVPPWARGRRAEILERIAERFGGSDRG